MLGAQIVVLLLLTSDAAVQHLVARHAFGYTR